MKLSRKYRYRQTVKSITPDDVRPMIEQMMKEAVNQIPVPQDGRSVTVDDVRPVLLAMVDDA